MHQGLQFLDIIFLGLIVAFLFFRLRGVLGRRTGNERPPTNPYSGRPNPVGARDGDGIVRPLPAPEDRRPMAGTVQQSGEPASALDAIRGLDPTFDAAHFLEGAQAAHTMIVEAFAAGDRAVLRDLVAPDVFERFDAALREREEKGLRGETTVVEGERAEIVGASARDRELHVTVRFASRIVSCVKDAEDRIVEGHPTVPQTVIDVWTFSRDIRSRDPNWLVIATAGEA